MPRFKRYEWDKMGARTLEAFNQDRPETIAVDTETEGFAWEAPAFCVTFTWRKPDGRLQSAYLDLDYDDHGSRYYVIRHILAKTKRWVFHNAKFDLQKLLLEGCIDREWIDNVTIEDTNIIHALLDENSRHGLKYLAVKLLGESTNEEKVLAKVRRQMKMKKDDGYHLLPRQVVVPYAMRDTEYTLRLYELLTPQLFATDMRELYASEVKTAIALLDIEAQGIALDVPYLEATASEYGKKVMRGYMELQGLAQDTSVPVASRKEFNPNSPKQIIEAFARLGKTVDATDKATLLLIEGDTNQPGPSALAKTLLEYRKNKKLHGTYLTAMLSEQRDGIIHPNFNLTLPRTGRMSSSAASNN